MSKLTATEFFDTEKDIRERPFDKFVVHSAAFSALRSSLRQIAKKLLIDSENLEAQEIAREIMRDVKNWLTSPVRFKADTLRAPAFFGDPLNVGNRWGEDLERYLKQSKKLATEIAQTSCPLRQQLAEVLQIHVDLYGKVHVFCQKDQREHFDLLISETDRVENENVNFIHSASEYRKQECFQSLIKVGPFRSRGFGFAPDAVFSAPRFSHLTQITWSECPDEEDFGFIPSHIFRISDEASPYENLSGEWRVQVETRGVQSPPEAEIDKQDDFGFFQRLQDRTELTAAVLLITCNGDGVLLPPRKSVFAWRPKIEPSLMIVSEDLDSGDYLIRRSGLEHSALDETKAASSNITRLWKKQLEILYRQDPDELCSRLRDRGVVLSDIRGSIRRWIAPPTSVIHAPQKEKHFKALFNLLLEVEGKQPSKNSYKAAWQEIKQSHSVAISEGHIESKLVEEVSLNCLRELKDQVEQHASESLFSMRVPEGKELSGTFEFHRIDTIESGFMVPIGALDQFCNPSEFIQWRD